MRFQRLRLAFFVAVFRWLALSLFFKAFLSCAVFESFPFSSLLLLYESPRRKPGRRFTAGMKLFSISYNAVIRTSGSLYLPLLNFKIFVDTLAHRVFENSEMIWNRLKPIFYSSRQHTNYLLEPLLINFNIFRWSCSSSIFRNFSNVLISFKF